MGGPIDPNDPPEQMPICTWWTSVHCSPNPVKVNQAFTAWGSSCNRTECEDPHWNHTLTIAKSTDPNNPFFSTGEGIPATASGIQTLSQTENSPASHGMSAGDQIIITYTIKCIRHEDGCGNRVVKAKTVNVVA